MEGGAQAPARRREAEETRPPLPHQVPETTAAVSSTSTSISAINTSRNADALAQNASLPAIDTLTASVPRVHIRTPSSAQTPRTPRDAGLHIETHITTPTPVTTSHRSHLAQVEVQDPIESSGNAKEQGSGHSNPIPIQRGGSLRSTLSAASMQSLSPSGSRLSSPMLNSLPDITPLPSPLTTQDSPKLWKTRSRPGSSGSLSRSLREEVLLDVKTKAGSPTKMKNKSYGTLTERAMDSSSTAIASSPHKNTSHKSSRSISEFQPGPLHNERPRIVTVGMVAGGHDGGSSSGEPMQVDSALHREKYLAEQRGLVQPRLPTPPPSNRSVTESEADDGAQEAVDDSNFVEYLTVREGPSKRKRKYRPIRELGKGTFSRVVLATSQKLPASTTLDESSESWLEPCSLVAIKVVQHGPAGGADEARVDRGLRREVEILRELTHPTLIHLKAFDYSESEALIVLQYCPGGDLFELASEHKPLLTAPVVQRMFAELVIALQYLHNLWIVHRDVKLENVLLNIPASELAKLEDPFAYPHPLITLTDLGLSRKIPKPPVSPMLTTRCGSEDYAAPEILLGSEYDGRKTDAWALGVLIYALMEGRLPFDPPPPRPGRRTQRQSSPVHRIARAEWIWCAFGDVNGEWDADAGRGWEPLRNGVEALLVKRNRIELDELAEKDYVKAAFAFEGELTRAPHTLDEEVEEGES